MKRLLGLLWDVLGLTAIAMITGGLVLVHPAWLLVIAGLLIGAVAVWGARRFGG